MSPSPDPRAPPPPSALPIPHSITGTATFARLTNEGPSLLTCPEQPATAKAAHPILPRDELAIKPQEEYTTKLPKHNFPRFNGELPRVWLDRCLAYFELYWVPPLNLVATVVLYVEGHAALWLRAFRQQHPVITWDLFQRAIEEEFGPEEFESLMHKLMQLRQTGTVVEYKQQFEVYMYNLLALDATLSPKFFVTQFLLGLNDELQVAVRIQAPTSITRATVFARIQEEELMQQRPSLRSTYSGRPPPLSASFPPTGRPPPAPAVATLPTVPAMAWPALVPRLAADDFGRERQLRDYRRQHDLCFRCGDKYSREHQCRRSAQLLTIEVGEHGEVLSDEAVRALQLLDEPQEQADPACCLLSAHAVEGTEIVETIRFACSRWRPNHVAAG